MCHMTHYSLTFSEQHSLVIKFWLSVLTYTRTLGQWRPGQRRKRRKKTNSEHAQVLYITWFKTELFNKSLCSIWEIRFVFANSTWYDLLWLQFPIEDVFLLNSLRPEHFTGFQSLQHFIKREYGWTLASSLPCCYYWQCC